MFYFNQAFLLFPERVINRIHAVSMISFPQELQVLLRLLWKMWFVYLSGSEGNLSTFLRDMSSEVFPLSFLLRLGWDAGVGTCGGKRATDEVRVRGGRLQNLHQEQDRQGPQWLWHWGHSLHEQAQPSLFWWETSRRRSILVSLVSCLTQVAWIRSCFIKANWVCLGMCFNYLVLVWAYFHMQPQAYASSMATPSALVCGHWKKRFIVRNPRNAVHVTGSGQIKAEVVEVRGKHIWHSLSFWISTETTASHPLHTSLLGSTAEPCQMSNYIFHSWSVCITFLWLPFKERKPLKGLYLIYSPKFDMFTVYCQQLFCTWKAKLLIFPPWPVPASKTGLAFLVFTVSAFACG